MKIILYCQHVLGIGHLFRTLEICKELVGHEVILVAGGPGIDAQFPEHVTVIHLPVLQMDSGFKGLLSADKNASLDQIKEKRQKKLLAIVEKERPDIFLLELYPFGRQAFRFELDPTLRAIRKQPSRCALISSVRDILVEKKKPKHERRAIERLNSYFDAVLVHSDPKWFALKETFSRFDEIKIPVIHTGYIAPKPLKDDRRKIRKHLGIAQEDVMIIASAGGGSVGKPVLESSIRAFDHLNIGGTLHLFVYTGPYIPESEFEDLKALKKSTRIQISKFTSDFQSRLTAADISISMGGYNTTMNILSAGVSALVWPFAANREQGLRAERLAERGALKLLHDQDLNPKNLARIVEEMLTGEGLQEVEIDLNGAVHTVRWLEGWIGRSLNNS